MSRYVVLWDKLIALKDVGKLNCHLCLLYNNANVVWHFSRQCTMHTLRQSVPGCMLGVHFAFVYMHSAVFLDIGLFMYYCFITLSQQWWSVDWGLLLRFAELAEKFRPLPASQLLQTVGWHVEHENIQVEMPDLLGGCVHILYSHALFCLTAWIFCYYGVSSITEVSVALLCSDFWFSMDGGTSKELNDLLDFSAVWTDCHALCIIFHFLSYYEVDKSVQLWLQDIYSTFVHVNWIVYLWCTSAVRCVCDIWFLSGQLQNISVILYCCTFE